MLSNGMRKRVSGAQRPLQLIAVAEFFIRFVGIKSVTPDSIRDPDSGFRLAPE
jgi:hypothetical protein